MNGGGERRESLNRGLHMQSLCALQKYGGHTMNGILPWDGERIRIMRWEFTDLVQPINKSPKVRGVLYSYLPDGLLE